MCGGQIKEANGMKRFWAKQGKGYIRTVAPSSSMNGDQSPCTKLKQCHAEPNSREKEDLCRMYKQIY